MTIDAGDERSGAVALGIDVGSTNVKVALICAGHAVEEIAVLTTPTPPDADELVRAVLDMVTRVLADAPSSPIAVGVASMAESGVPLDSEDRPLLPIVRWDGADDSGDFDALIERFGVSELFDITGVPALPKTPLAIWARMRRRQPEAWSEMRRWAGVADLVGFALTGALATDHTLAARTMAYRLPREGIDGGFDDELLAAVGLSTASLPEVRDPGQPVGGVLASVSERTGLVEGLPVFIAGHDHAVGAWAAGAREPGDVADSIGTAEALIRVLDTVPASEAIRPTGMTITRTVTGAPALLAGASSAGRFARWWFEQHLRGQDPAAVLHLLDEAAGPTGLTVLPYLTGRQTPDPDPRVISRVFDEHGDPLDAAGLPVETLVTAMFEGLSLHARWMLSAQTAIAGPETAPIRVLGGPGGASRPWMRVKAQVYPTATRLTTVAEPVACGAALLAAAHAGAFPGDIPELPGTALNRLPGDPYHEAYERFVRLATD